MADIYSQLMPLVVNVKDLGSGVIQGWNAIISRSGHGRRYIAVYQDKEYSMLRSSFFVRMTIRHAVEVIHSEREVMEYSVNQINNLLRTYPQHLKVRPTLRDKETPASRDPRSVDRVSISPEGRRRLAEAETTSSTSR